MTSSVPNIRISTEASDHRDVEGKTGRCHVLDLDDFSANEIFEILDARSSFKKGFCLVLVPLTLTLP